MCELEDIDTPVSSMCGMCVYVCVCVCMCVYVCVCVCLCLRVRGRERICVYECVHSSTRVHQYYLCGVCVCVYASLHERE